MSPVATEANCVNIAPPLSELFAVCDDLNEQIILTADTVHRLSPLKSYESLVITEPATLVLSDETHDSAEPVRREETVTEEHYPVTAGIEIVSVYRSDGPLLANASLSILTTTVYVGQPFDVIAVALYAGAADTPIGNLRWPSGSTTA